MEIQPFETCTTYLVQNGIPDSMKTNLFGTKFTEIHFFETCTSYLVQNGIQEFTFLVRGGQRRARPARRASPAAWSRLAARWAALREGKEGRAQGRGSAEERLEHLPHSYHRRWVIWYFYTFHIFPFPAIIKHFLEYFARRPNIYLFHFLKYTVICNTF